MGSKRQRVTEIEVPLCGNIYCDGFWDQGVYYRDYSVDCAVCAREDTLDLHGQRTKTVAVRMGWTISPEHGKWLCPNCSKGLYGQVKTD